MTNILQFGERLDGVTYVDRAGAYLVLLNSVGEVAIIDVDGEYHLPGGGIEAGESALQAVRREAMEEIGIDVKVGKKIAEANQYVYSAFSNRYLNKLCTYFLGQTVDQAPPLRSAQHTAICARPSEARLKLDHQSHTWAVGEAEKLTEHMVRPAEEQDFSAIMDLLRQLNPDDPVIGDGSDRAIYLQILQNPNLHIFVGTRHTRQANV